MFVAKIELETKDVEDYFASDVGYSAEELEIKHQALAAAREGVRYTRSASVELDPKMQGNLDMLRTEALEKREELKSDDEIQGVIRTWWESIENKMVTRLGQATITKDQYMFLCLSLHHSLAPEDTEEEMLEAAERDWEVDSKGNDVMDYNLFYDGCVALALIISRAHWTNCAIRLQHVRAVRSLDGWTGDPRVQSHVPNAQCSTPSGTKHRRGTAQGNCCQVGSRGCCYRSYRQRGCHCCSGVCVVRSRSQ